MVPRATHPRWLVVDLGLTGWPVEGTRLVRVNRRTKIVCTLGPAVASEEGIRELVDAGMDVARLNFSHGEHADHEANYRWVRKASD